MNSSETPQTCECRIDNDLRFGVLFTSVIVRCDWCKSLEAKCFDLEGTVNRQEAGLNKQFQRIAELESSLNEWRDMAEELAKELDALGQQRWGSRNHYYWPPGCRSTSLLARFDDLKEKA